MVTGYWTTSMVYKQKVTTLFDHMSLKNVIDRFHLFSGGIERSWIGVPRRYFDSSTKLERCVCVENANERDGRFKEYKDCSPTSSECQIFD